ncbi:MAG: phosphotransferase [Litorilinea sp.]
MLSTADRSLIRQERHIPGLEAALSAPRMAEIIQGALCGDDFPELAAYYVRYKPGTSCLVGYHASIDGRAAYCYATAYAPVGYAKLQALARLLNADAKPNPCPSVAPGAIDLARGIGIRFAHADRKITASARLWCPDGLRAILARALPDLDHTTDSASPAALHAEILRYKPERRLVARLQVGAQHYLLKAYTAHDYQLVAPRAKHMPHPGGVHLQARLGKSARHHVQLFEWLDGTPLDARLADATPDQCAALMDAVAQALADLHNAPAPGKRSPSHTQEWNRTVIAGDALQMLVPTTGQAVAALLQTLQPCLASPSPVNAPIHNDCSADQFIRLPDQRLALLDWDQAAWGDPMRDLAAFAANLYLKATSHGFVDRARVEPAIQRLLRAYAQAAPDNFAADRFRAHLAARLLRLAPEPFRHRRAHWDQDLLALLHCAQEICHHDF